MTDVKDAFKISSDPMYLHKLSFNSSYQDTVLADIFTGNMLITRERPPGPGAFIPELLNLIKTPFSGYLHPV